MSYPAQMCESHLRGRSTLVEAYRCDALNCHGNTGVTRSTDGIVQYTRPSRGYQLPVAVLANTPVHHMLTNHKTTDHQLMP